MLLRGPEAGVQTTRARTCPAHMHELFVGTWTHTSDILKVRRVASSVSVLALTVSSLDYFCAKPRMKVLLK